uniref:sentrin-specific protease 6-like isoform X2 n=1 Tax=Styela clava TaxID=7725 RepID=UPI001939F9CF|nr:sentrin-specific protease 6-like isoform X2 [Styela clava]
MAPENGADNSNNSILSETKFNDSSEHNLVVENASQRTDENSQAKTDNKSDVPTSVTSDSGNSVASEVTSGKEQHKESITVYKRPCILVFDSLRGPSRSKIAASLREYLTMEWKTRKSKSFGTKVFDKDSMRMCSVVVPQQDNYTDCGLFLLHYFEKFFRAPIQSYAPPIKILDWFDPDECKTKREEIKKVIDDLHEEWKKKEET